MTFIVRLKRIGTRNYSTLFYGKVRQFTFRKREEGLMYDLKPVLFSSEKEIDRFISKNFPKFGYKPEEVRR